MNQSGSYGFEHQLAAGMRAELAADNQHNAVHEMEAREQMVAARREQQRLQILRRLGYRY